MDLVHVKTRECRDEPVVVVSSPTAGRYDSAALWAYKFSSSSSVFSTIFLSFGSQRKALHWEDMIPLVGQLDILQMGLHWPYPCECCLCDVVRNIAVQNTFRMQYSSNSPSSMLHYVAPDYLSIGLVHILN